MKRRGFAKEDGSAVEKDSTLNIFRRIRLVCFQVLLCFINIFLSFSALIVLIFASRCARVTACDSHQLSLSVRLVASGATSSTGIQDDATPSDPPLRKCQQDCLEACAKGARKIEMACGTGKTRVMKELVGNVSGKASWCLCMPSRVLPPAEFVEFFFVCVGLLTHLQILSRF